MLNPGIRIYEYRLALKISQAELAERAGLAQANLSNIEKGKRDLTVSTLLRIAAALRVKPSQLIDSEDSGRRLELTRDEIEKLAKVIVRPAAKIPPALKETASLFREILPDINPRFSAKKTNLAWAKLRQRLTQTEIKSILARIEDARQRSDAEKTD